MSVMHNDGRRHVLLKLHDNRIIWKNRMRPLDAPADNEILVDCWKYPICREVGLKERWSRYCNSRKSVWLSKKWSFKRRSPKSTGKRVIRYLVGSRKKQGESKYELKSLAEYTSKIFACRTSSVWILQCVSYNHEHRLVREQRL